MEKKDRFIILSSPNDKELVGGVVVVETVNKKSTCFVSLYGVNDFNPILLIDDLVKVRQFEISKNFSEIDLDPAVGFATDLVVGLFNNKKNLIASGSTFGEETEENRERLKIAIEKDDRLAHFLNLAKNVVDNDLVLSQKQNNTFLDKTQALLFELFAYGIPDKSLARFVPNSFWVKLFLKTDVVGVGIVQTAGNITGVGLAFPVLSKNYKHKAVDENFVFFPQNLSNPEGFGYYIVLQNASDGSIVNIK